MPPATSGGGVYTYCCLAERFDFVNERSACRLREMDIIMQINVYSVKEEKSVIIRGRVNMLLRNQFVDFTESDAHRMNH